MMNSARYPYRDRPEQSNWLQSSWSCASFTTPDARGRNTCTTSTSAIQPVSVVDLARLCHYHTDGDENDSTL